jgi:hypothetical protein
MLDNLLQHFLSRRCVEEEAWKTLDSELETKNHVVGLEKIYI